MVTVRKKNGLFNQTYISTCNGKHIAEKRQAANWMQVVCISYLHRCIPYHISSSIPYNDYIFNAGPMLTDEFGISLPISWSVVTCNAPRQNENSCQCKRHTNTTFHCCYHPFDMHVYLTITDGLCRCFATRC